MVPSGTLFWPENQIAAPSSAYKVRGPVEAPITAQATGGSDREAVSQVTFHSHHRVLRLALLAPFY